MRIVAGKFRSRKLLFPSAPITRPTSDRTRESVFNILYSLSSPINADTFVLDAFAGSGALGLEALSRGAGHVTFIEKNPAAIRILRENIANLQVDPLCSVLMADTLNPPHAPHPMDLVFLDPPYHQGLEEPCLKALQAQGWIMKDTVVVLETSSRQNLSLTNVKITKQHRYGAAMVSFLHLDLY